MLHNFVGDEILRLFTGEFPFSFRNCSRFGSITHRYDLTYISENSDQSVYRIQIIVRQENHLKVEDISIILVGKKNLSIPQILRFFLELSLGPIKVIHKASFDLTELLNWKTVKSSKEDL